MHSDMSGSIGLSTLAIERMLGIRGGTQRQGIGNGRMEVGGETSSCPWVERSRGVNSFAIIRRVVSMTAVDIVGHVCEVRKREDNGNVVKVDRDRKLMLKGQ